MLLRYLLILVVGLARYSRAEYKWTGSEWVYLEDNRDTIEQYDGSGGDGGDDEDYLYEDDDDISLGGGAAGGKTGLFQPADNKGGSIGSTDSFNQQHGGIDSSKFNFVRPGITDDEDFYEGSGAGSASIPLGGGAGGLPIDSFNEIEGSGSDDDTEQYPFGGNANLSPSFPSTTTTTTTSQSPPIEIEDSDFGGTSFGGNNGQGSTIDQSFGGVGGDTSNTNWNTEITPDEDDDYYDDYKDKEYGPDDKEYSPYDDYDDEGTTGISIDDRKPFVPSVVNPTLTSSTPIPFYPPVETTSSTRRPIVPEPPIVTDVPTNRPVSFFAQPGILAAVIGGAVVGLLCAILLVMFIVYRMRKKDEGSYILDEPKRVHNGNVYTKTPNREFYA